MQNGTAVTMPAVKAMLKTQERAAEECGVGFWNTYEAMGGNNSMPKFVERHWAAKDYTHIGYPGGKYIAEQFVKFINAAVENVREQDAEKARRAEQLRREEEKRRAATLLGRGRCSTTASPTGCGRSRAEPSLSGRPMERATSKPWLPMALRNL